MKIFVLLSRIPWPLEKGDKLRSFNQIKCLSKNNDVYLCALNDDKSVDEDKAKSILTEYCKSVDFIQLSKFRMLINVGLAFCKGMPIQCGYFYNRKVHGQIKEIINTIKPDVSFGQLVRVSPYLIDETCVKVIDYQDVLSIGMKRRMVLAKWFFRPIFKMEYKRLRRYERFVFDKFDVKTIISDSDRQLIDHPQRNEILIVPNGVDFEHFKQIQTEKKYDIVFTGNMAYPPNVNAVMYLSQEIMHFVWSKIPNAKLCIAGATPVTSVKAVANDNIEVTGWVDDMRDVYAKSKIFIAPMRIGTGLQNKLLEAMAMQLPCITTPLANNALLANDKSEILVGSSAKELADAIVLLLSDEIFAKKMAEKGNMFVHDKYDWSASTQKMEDAMRKCLNKKEL